MPGPRDYSAGTERALFAVSQGTCYFPGCRKPVVEFVEGVPIVNVHISHIRGANPNSARYDPSMTDEERAAYANVALLCKPHHDLVDRIKPLEYPAEALQQWKLDHEQAGLGALVDLQGLTEERLSELIESLVLAMGPVREVILKLTGGIGGEVSRMLSVPIEGWRILLEHNQHLTGEQAVIATARNTGTRRAVVEDFTIYVNATSGKADVPLTLMGRNDFPDLNPQLPAPLEVGASLSWLTKLDTMKLIITSVRERSLPVTDFWSVVRLGSGESIESPRFPVSHLPID